MAETEITNELLIISNLLQNENFLRRVLPHIKSEYFENVHERKCVDLIIDYFNQYNLTPKIADLAICIKNDESVAGIDNKKKVLNVVREALSFEACDNYEFLLSTSEEFCKRRACYLALIEGIEMFEGKHKTKKMAAFPKIMEDALAVSFDSQIGMDFNDDAEARFDFYHSPKSKIISELECLNDVTGGGIPRKTLNVFIAGVNVGKTMCLVGLAAGYARKGYNVLYISNEIRAESILHRIDANFLKLSIDDVLKLSREKYISKLNDIKEKSYGKIKVKDFPPGVSTSAHYRAVINELKQKQKFVPDVIIVDYIQITAPATLRNTNANTFERYKAVAEELRALAIEFDAIVWTASQFNRSGMADTDAEMTDVGESLGIPATADGMWSITRTETLDEMGQLLIKQLKSRYADKAKKTRFPIGADFEKQIIYDVVEGYQPPVNMKKGGEVKSFQPKKDKLKGLKV